MLAAWLCLLAPASSNAALKFPPLTGRVVDAANVLPAATRASIEGKLANLEASTGRQLVVATVPDLQGTSIEDYGYQMLRTWGIGSKARNDGAILIVAPTEHRVRVEVGYGLEPVLTDALSSIIISQAITPRAKAGDLPGAIDAGTDALIQQLKLPDDQARANVAAATQQQAQAAQGERRSGGGSWVFILIILAVFILPRLFGRGLGFLPFLFMGGGGGWGGGGWGGGSSGGGGGFSGGGGSGGGGGASGSW